MVENPLSEGRHTFRKYALGLDRLGDIDIAIEFKPKIASNAEFQQMLSPDSAWPQNKADISVPPSLGYVAAHGGFAFPPAAFPHSQ